ncbi:MAG: dihydroxy-acid dehydratase [Alphaproteobacteria bacterium]|nr:dihydroxy-acid dehydratase [Alphaproteobacteria bacterium]
MAGTYPKDPRKGKRRSSQWYGKADRDGYAHRSWMKNRGLPADQFDGRPIIGICNTWSEFNPCNAHFRDIAERVKRGVYESGGVPMEFPVFSNSESQLRPTAMLYRNLASMDVEESIRGLPMDGVVLLVGCDKTTPALMMGAASCDLPTIVVSGGPMLNGHYRGEQIGSGTHVWKFSEMVKAGEMSLEDFMSAEQDNARSAGHCMTMGTASTMASLAESIGIALHANAAIPAVDSRRYVLAQMAGRRIVDMVREDITMSSLLKRENFENAIMVNGAIGGSTNAVIHMLAIAGRMGIDITLDDWDRLGRNIPCLVNLMPSGAYLMEDFFYAGGLPAVIRELDGYIHKDAKTANGRTIWENCSDARTWNREVIFPVDRPFKPNGGIAVLRGNLAPDGAIIKPSAASPELMTHRGRAVVFESVEDYRDRIEDPELDIDETCIMVLKYCGPKGYPGMAEVGNMGLPPKILKKGVTDMVRISDARMSGTAYGTVVLHTAPEAAAGGPLAFVRNGDMIEIDVPGRRLHLDVPDEELERRRAAWNGFESPYDRGYTRIYVEHVTQADTGADLDFLVGKSGTPLLRESH